MAANKIVTAQEAVALIRDGDTVAVSGFVGIGTPDELIIALAERFRQTQAPSGLTLMFAAAPGDGKERGLNRLADERLVQARRRRALVARAEARRARARQQDRGLQPAARLRLASLPRHRAQGCPGRCRRSGLRTFVDPRLGGGKLNVRTTEDLVELVELRGKPWLLYKTFPIQIALVRGTTADPAGNITMEREALMLDNLASAMAAKNSGGLVIAQVERIAAADSLSPREVAIPGVLVDCVVVAAPENHLQTYGTPYNHAYSGRQKVPLDRVEPLPLDERKIVARRCAFELPPGGVVNLGIGMPEGVAAVAAEERVLKYLTLTAEPGIIGGMPQGGLDFGAALNPDAVIHQNQQFDFYDGGGLDLACLGMAQADGRGNVNVSRFGRKLAGAGGFINISQNAKKLVLRRHLHGRRARNRRRGRTAPDRPRRQDAEVPRRGRADHLQRRLRGRDRPAGALRDRALRLPAHARRHGACRGRAGHRYRARHPRPYGLRPRSSTRRSRWTPRIFRPEVMGLEQALLGLSLAERISYDAERNTIFLNFEGFQVRTLADVDLVRREMERQCRAIGRKVALVVNYDGFTLDPAVSDAYFSMITYMESRYYASASRYTTSAFMRLKLGAGLSERDLKPHVFETPAEAHAFAAAHNTP